MLSMAAEALPPPYLDRRACLRQIISELSVITDKEMKLASGMTSTIYFDMRRTTLHPEGADLIADEILEILKDEPVDCIGGLVVGAVPLVAAVSIKSYPKRPIPGFFVRKEPKAHGTRKLIDGNFRKGDVVVILDDVTTSGGSVMKAVRAVRESGGRVSKVITVVDRLEGARENLKSEGVKLVALFTKDDFQSRPKD